MFCFRDLLASENIDPADTNIMLHSPFERDFAKVLPSLFQERPHAFDVFQSSHSTSAEAALLSGRQYVASFIKTGRCLKNQGHSRLVFAGLFRNNPDRPVRTIGDIWQEPEIRFLHNTYGLDYGQEKVDPKTKTTWFDLRSVDVLADLRGRLVISARLTPSYVRLAENLEAPVLAVLERGVSDMPVPDWKDMTASAAVMRAVPTAWAAALREWRGVYLITDESDGARYVGSAYGADNILGRWREHVAGANGITKELSKRNPANFRFSILQLLAPDADASDVINIEHGWMDRLHTREFGLNV